MGGGAVAQADHKAVVEWEESLGVDPRGNCQDWHSTLNRGYTAGLLFSDGGYSHAGHGVTARPPLLGEHVPRLGDGALQAPCGGFDSHLLQLAFYWREI